MQKITQKQKRKENQLSLLSQLAKATNQNIHCSCSTQFFSSLEPSLAQYSSTCRFQSCFSKVLVPAFTEPQPGDQSPLWSQDPLGLLHLCLLHQPHRDDVPHRRWNRSPQQVLSDPLCLWFKFVEVLLKLVTSGKAIRKPDSAG